MRPGQVAPSVRLMSSSMESDAEFDARFFQILYFKFLSPRVWNFRSDWHLTLILIALGTLPTSTEQISMAGRSERFIVLLNFFRKQLIGTHGYICIRYVGTSCWYLRNSGLVFSSNAMMLSHHLALLKNDLCSNTSFCRAWATSAPWTWYLSPPSSPPP